MICRLERGFQSYHFIKNATSGPNVGLFVIARLMYLLWGHVEWRAYISLRVLRLSREDPWKTKVSKLNVIVQVKEYIARLYVSMKNSTTLLVLVALLQGKNNLHKDFPNDVLRHIVFLDFAFLDELCHVSIFTVLSDDVELASFLINDSDTPII